MLDAKLTKKHWIWIGAICLVILAGIMGIGTFLYNWSFFEGLVLGYWCEFGLLLCSALIAGSLLDENVSLRWRIGRLVFATIFGVISGCACFFLKGVDIGFSILIGVGLLTWSLMCLTRGRYEKKS